MHPTLVRAVCLLLLLGIISARSDPAPGNPDAHFPEALRAWRGWVLRDDRDLACPLASDRTTRFCAWPGTLALRLAGAEASFQQSWHIYRQTAVMLPATAAAWPMDVTLDGTPAPTTEQDGHPVIWLDPGAHRIQGQLQFPRPPTAFDIDPHTTTFALSAGDSPLNGSTPEGAGRIWLQSANTTPVQTAADVLSYEVFRKWTDGIPQRLASHYRLKVAGNPREVMIGPVLPKGFQPLRLDSPLPARIEADNQLRLQVQPGTWILEVVGRATRQQDRLDYFPPLDAFGTDQEVWVIETQPDLRQVDSLGDHPIDPHQSLLPQAWQDLPAFLMGPGQTLRLIEKRRGDPTPAPNRLRLSRTLWLDMGGQGWSLRDLIEGEVNRGWRLNVLPALELGRVTLDGQPQYITRDPDGPIGVELRQGRVRLVGESRISGRPDRLPATGWTADFTSVTTQLHLPPGWRLLHVQGAEHVSAGWVQRWTLLDLFLLLMLAIVFLKLWDWLWALLALLGLGLTIQTPGAPVWVWVHLLIAIGLLRVLPTGRMRRWVSWYKGVSVLVLLLIALPFVFSEIRTGLHPQLDALAIPVDGALDLDLFSDEAPLTAMMAPSDMEMAPVPQEAPRRGRLGKLAVPGGTAKALLGSSARLPARVQQLDPTIQIQTGPGMPTWSRPTSELRWTGSVEPEQQIVLWLLSPGMNLLRVIVTIPLLLLLIYRVLDIPAAAIRQQGRHVLKRTPPGAPLLILAVLGLGSVAPQVRADIPDADVLKAYREILIEAPECHPHCATFAALRVTIAADRLALALRIHAVERVAVPLPIQIDQWQPQEVTLNGTSVEHLVRDGSSVWMLVEPGVQEVLIHAALAGRHALTLPLPLSLHNVDLALEGWQASGVRDGQPIASAIQLRRMAAEREGAASGLTPTALPPFAQVERTFHFGLEWGVETVVRRLSDHSSDILLHYPLLAGESVTTPGILVTDGVATVALGQSQDETRFSSALSHDQAHMTLTAGPGQDWVEAWMIDAGPLWHVTATGLPPVRQPLQERVGPRRPLYRPLPGEHLTLAISRPAGVPGPTTTLQQLTIEGVPGRHVTDYTTHLRLLSSQGGHHRLELPNDAQLQGLRVDGRALAIDGEATMVDIALHPGEQDIELRWRIPAGLGLRYALPEVRFGLPLNNIEIEVQIPEDRWVLWTHGPIQGPAVLFWASLALITLLALILGYSGRTPLRPLHWLLLGIGLAPVSLFNALVVALCFFALGAKGQVQWERRGTTLYNLTQGALLLLTLAAVVALTGSIEQGLLGHPDMQIAGNGSSGHVLKWYLDRAAAGLPEIQVISVPLWLYRLLMLGWAMWLALQVIRWSGWVWRQWSTPETWRPIQFRWRRRPLQPGAGGIDG